MKAGKVVETLQILHQVGQGKMPIKLSYAFSKNITVFQREHDIIEKERLALAKSLGVPNEKTGQFEFGDNLEKWTDEYGQLLDSDVDVHVHKIKFTDIGDFEIPPVFLSRLIDAGIITEPEA